MKASYIFALLLTGYSIFAVFHARHRVIDGDEGYYASAARLVGEGKMPYVDFFYPQAPILPFVYGAWTQLNGYSLAWLRALSAILTAGTLALWGWFLLVVYGKVPWVAYAAFFAVLFSPFLLSWGVLIKTFALGNFLATTMLICIWRASRSRNMKWMLLAGVSSGLLVSTRLLYAAVPVAVAIWIFFRVKAVSGLQPRSSLLSFAAGTAVASIPALLLYIHDPDVFMFNNLGYHFLRSEPQPLYLHMQHAASFLGETVVAHPYMILVIILALLGVYAATRSVLGKTVDPSALNEVALVSTAGLLVVSLTPIPLYEQYFTGPLAPMLVPLVAAGIQVLWHMSRYLVYALALCVMPISYGEFHHEMTQASAMKGWQITAYDRVAQYIRNHTEPSDTVLSPWPGYACESGRNFLPGFENQFALPVSERLTDSQQQHYHVGGKKAFIAAVREQIPKLIVIGAWVSPLFVTMNEGDKEQLYQALDQQYRFASQIEDVSVYERKPSGR